MPQGPVTDFARERLIHQAPERVVQLTEADLAYITETLTGVDAAFGGGLRFDVPVATVPARMLMRKMLDMRSSLDVVTEEQREALGRLASAILRLEVACAFARDHEAAAKQRG